MNVLKNITNFFFLPEDDERINPTDLIWWYGGFTMAFIFWGIGFLSYFG